MLLEMFTYRTNRRPTSLPTPPHSVPVMPRGPLPRVNNSEGELRAETNQTARESHLRDQPARTGCSVCGVVPQDRIRIERIIEVQEHLTLDTPPQRKHLGEPQIEL